MNRGRALGLLLAPAALALLQGCAAPRTGTTTIADFTTDGCSLFPDRASAGGKDWCRCCAEHDLAYWRGGTQQQRAQADEALRACVRERADSPALATLMLLGVRAGGGPQWPTTFRWGYGWDYGRFFTPLNAAEVEQATQKAHSFRARFPDLQCPAAEAEQR